MVVADIIFMVLDHAQIYGSQKMKRSEAIKLIMETFEYEGLGTQMRKKDAGAIIDGLVEAGMLPPPRPGVYDSVPTVTPTGHADYSWKREWAPENEDFDPAADKNWRERYGKE